MNPLKIKITLTHNFDFHGVLRYSVGAFASIMPKKLAKLEIQGPAG